MNILVLSPNFPSSNINFCSRLKFMGENVLCIGDTDECQFNDETKQAMTHYYKVNSLDNYEAVYRAVCFFISLYGRIDRVESFNPYWLPLEVKLREEFHLAGNTNAPTFKKAPIGTKYCYSALLNKDKKPLVEITYATFENGYIVTDKEVDSKIQTVAHKVLAKSGVSENFVTVETHFNGTSYVVDNIYGALPALVIDMMNYATDSDLYSLYAMLVSGEKTEILPQIKYISVGVTNDFNENNAPILDDENALVQEAPVQYFFAKKFDSYVYVFRMNSVEEVQKSFLIDLAKPVAKSTSKKTTTRAKKNVVLEDKTVETVPVAEINEIPTAPSIENDDKDEIIELSTPIVDQPTQPATKTKTTRTRRKK